MQQVAEPSPSCVEALREVLAHCRTVQPTMTYDLTRAIHDGIPELDEDPELFGVTLASVEANVGLIYARMCSGAEPSTTGVPGDALQLAFELVHQGLSLPTLTRIYRLGHHYLWGRWQRYVVACVRDPELLDEVLRYSADWLFAWVDMLSERLTAEYAEERTRWARSSSGQRVEAVRAVLAGSLRDGTAASRRLGYPLARRQHLALLLWLDDLDGSVASLRIFERAAHDCAAAVDALASLVVPLGPQLVGVWLGTGEAPDVDVVLRAARRERLGVAAGTPAPGLDGFRESHEQAVLARRTWRLLDGRCTAGVAYDRVAVEALLTEEPERARAVARRELGALAAGDDATARIVATLRVYFEEQQNVRRTARRLGLHHNTVAYRVKRAEDLLGRPVGERPLRLLAALALAPLLRE